MQVSTGDTIEISSRQVGAAVRRGQVTEVLSTDPLELRIQWEDEHESVIYPSGGMLRVVDSKS